VVGDPCLNFSEGEPDEALSKTQMRDALAMDEAVRRAAADAELSFELGVGEEAR
jgi:hypothetical protein